MPFYNKWILYNTLSLMVMLVLNFAGATGFFNTPTVGAISDKYPTLITPAGYAFSIWSLIFLLLIGFVAYQWIVLRKNDPQQYIERCGPWFTISNLLNGLWIVCWINEWLLAATVVIVLLLASVCIVVKQLGLELTDEPLLTILFVWWPISIYLGWLLVATITCIAALLVSLHWGSMFNESLSTVSTLLFALVIYALMLFKRNLRESLIVGAWAYVAIAVKQWQHSAVAITALGGAVFLFALASIHAYKNQSTWPFAKLKAGEW